jgi:hypothetical protein
MQDDDEHTNDRGRVAGPLRRTACLAAMPIALGVLVAGCGSNSPTGGVASLGSHGSKTSSAAAGADGEASPAAQAGSGGGEASPGSQAIAYATCMHSRGVPSFPEPQISQHGSEVRVKMVAPVGAFKGDPKFTAAAQACRKLLPSGGPSSQPAVSPAEQAQYLKAAACIRSHGVPNFPDPTFAGGGVHLDHKALNESSPVFKAAVHACESLIPGGVHGGSGSAHEAAPAP